jgi:dihydrolipoamide dehydrogenase
MSPTEEHYDVLVLGAGPGGYAAAIWSAQLGFRTGLVERSELGGVCLNLGCIPSKAMLRGAELLADLEGAAVLGIDLEGLQPNYAAAVARRERVVDHARQGVVNLLKGNGVTVIRGQGRLVGAYTLRVESSDQFRDVAFDQLIIATGSSPARPPIPGGELPGVIDSNGALALRDAPKRVVVIGAGAVGVEWADIWRAFGSEVTILEMLPRIVPTEDPEISRELARAFARKAIACYPNAQVREIRPSGHAATPEAGLPPALEVLATIDGEERTLAADVVLTATGRRPNVGELKLATSGVDWSPKGIPVDGQLRTNVPHIFAIGDVTGLTLLAHAATHQAKIAVEAIAGHDPEPFDPASVPAAIFTDPEIASMGVSEAQAKERDIPIQVARFPFVALGRAGASGEPTGFVKMVADERDGRILGVHIVGAHAGDLIGEASLAIRLGATLRDLAETIHVHPTFSEALLETAWVGLATPLHVPPRRQRRGPSADPAREEARS